MFFMVLGFNCWPQSKCPSPAIRVLLLWDSLPPRRARVYSLAIIGGGHLLGVGKIQIICGLYFDYSGSNILDVHL